MSTPRQQIEKQVGPYLLRQALQHHPMYTLHLARRKGGSIREADRLVKVGHGGASRDSSSGFLELEAEILGGVDGDSALCTPLETSCFDGRTVSDFGPLDGVALSGLLRMRRSRNSRLAVGESAWIALRLLYAVSSVSPTERGGESIEGLVCHGHGDANVLVTPQGGLRIIGLADIIIDGQRPPAWGWSTLTAPEYCQPGPAIGTAADIYAVGALLFRLLTLRPVISAPQLDEFVLRRMFRDIHPLPSDVYEDLSAFDPIVDRALRRDPDARYASANEFAADIKAIIEEQGATIERLPATLYEEARDAGIVWVDGGEVREREALGARTTDILESGWRESAS